MSKSKKKLRSKSLLDLNAEERDKLIAAAAFSHDRNDENEQNYSRLSYRRQRIANSLESNSEEVNGNEFFGQ